MAIVENATNSNERRILGQLDTIESIARERSVRPPATIIVGDVVNAL